MKKSILPVCASPGCKRNDLSGFGDASIRGVLPPLATRAVLAPTAANKQCSHSVMGGVAAAVLDLRESISFTQQADNRPGQLM
jgi:hypothetical protein